MSFSTEWSNLVCGNCAGIKVQKYVSTEIEDEVLKHHIGKKMLWQSAVCRLFESLGGRGGCKLEQVKGVNIASVMGMQRQ